jgi:replication-associated recombination protein RarA
MLRLQERWNFQIPSLQKYPSRMYLAALETALVRYDREGEQHYDTISAFIKSIRGSDPDAALHYLARMLEGGEDPRFIARRLMILASEDIGLADSAALPLAVAAFDTVAAIGMPEARIALSQVSIYLALAPKSNSAYLAINSALEDVRAGFTPAIPMYLRSSYSARAGSDRSYAYPHDEANAVVRAAVPRRDSGLLRPKAFWPRTLICRAPGSSSSHYSGQKGLMRPTSRC